MKKLHLALVALGAAALAAGCGGGGGSSSGGSATPTGTVQITNTNAPAVAKGGMTPSQSMAKQGSTGASTVGVVVQTGAPRKSVMDIALAEIKRVKSIKVPMAPAGVVGTSISPFPVAYSCAAGGAQVLPNTANSMTIDVQGLSTNGIFTVGNVASITYTSCAIATTTINGSMSLTINSSNGVSPAAGTLSESVSMNFNGFTVDDTAPVEHATLSGGFTMAITDNGTTLTATMSGTSFIMTSSTDGTFTMKDFSIGYTETIATSAYSFSVTMTTTCAALVGDIGITTTIPFTGTGTGEPTAGVMVISGVGGSSVTLTANSNGMVTQVVNDTTTTPATVTTTQTTWAAI